MKIEQLKEELDQSNLESHIESQIASVLHSYVRGDYDSKQVQKTLKKIGFKADLRYAFSNAIFVLDLNTGQSYEFRV